MGKQNLSAWQMWNDKYDYYKELYDATEKYDIFNGTIHTEFINQTLKAMVKEKPMESAGSHVMVDLETLSTSPKAAFTSIGAVRFDPNTGAPPPYIVMNSKGIPENTENQFYLHVNPVSAQKNGLAIDIDTVMWWMGQSDEARAELVKSMKAPSLDMVINSFRMWLNGTDTLYLWSHGSSFDLPILQNAFKAASYRFPGDFRNWRDTRTVYDIVQAVTGKPFEYGEYPGLLKHHALADAIRQANDIYKAYDILHKLSGMSYNDAEWKNGIAGSVLSTGGSDEKSSSFDITDMPYFDGVRVRESADRETRSVRRSH